MMGKYGKNMRDCCDSVAQPGTAHIAGCISATPAPDGLDVVAWECTDLIMGGEPGVITDVDHERAAIAADATEDVVLAVEAIRQLGDTP